MFGLKDDEILTCLLLIVVGYTIAKMFSKRCEGFNVGGVKCPSLHDGKIPYHELSTEMNKCYSVAGCSFDGTWDWNTCIPFDKTASCTDVSNAYHWTSIHPEDRQPICNNYGETNNIEGGCIYGTLSGKCSPNKV